MDHALLMTSFVFGMIGMGMFVYGKKAGRPMPLAAGMGLMILPYFFTHLLMLLLVCCALTAVPWLFRDA